jgi:hypothetical protein
VSAAATVIQGGVRAATVRDHTQARAAAAVRLMATLRGAGSRLRVHTSIERIGGAMRGHATRALHGAAQGEVRELARLFEASDSSGDGRLDSQEPDP